MFPVAGSCRLQLFANRAAAFIPAIGAHLGELRRSLKTNQVTPIGALPVSRAEQVHPGMLCLAAQARSLPVEDPARLTVDG